MSTIVELLKKINKSKFKIFNSPAIELNRKVYDPNFTLAEKKQLRIIFRLLLNEYLIDFYKWEPEQEVREAVAKIGHPVFNDRKLSLETYVGKHFMPLMKIAPNFKHLVEQTDLRKLPEISVSDLLQLETPINKHPVFHAQLQDEIEEDTKLDSTNKDPVTKDDEVEVIIGVTQDQLNHNKINEYLQFIAGLAGLSGPDAIKFATRYKNQPLNTNNAKVFFGRKIPQAKLEDLNFALGLMNLTDGHERISQELFVLPNTNSIKDLAKNTSVDWKNIVVKRVGEPRTNFDGNDLEEKVAHAHPTAYVMARLQNKPALLVKFLANNPQIDIFSFRIDYKNGKLYSWNGITPKQKPQLRKELQSLVRARKLVSDIRHLPTLLNYGFTSAQQILSEGRKRFFLKSGFEKKPEIGKNIYKRAQKIGNETMAMLSLHLDNMRNGPLPFMNTGSNVSQSDDETDYQEIFGSLNNCTCEHCNSVLSPAAYFVDLIHYISNNYPDALKELKDRRPDLWNINLSCDETFNTEPYLQLIVEVLETYVVEKGNEIFPDAPDTIEDILYLPSLSPETPFEYNHLRTRLFAKELDTSLYDMYTKMEVDLPFVMAEKIGLGPETSKWVIAGQPLWRNTLPKRYKYAAFAAFYNLNSNEVNALISSEIGEKLSIVSEVVNDQNGQSQGIEHFVVVETNTQQPLKEAAAYLKNIFTFLRIYRHLEFSLEDLDFYVSLSKVGQKYFTIEHMGSFSLLLYLKDTFSFTDRELELMKNGYSETSIEDLGGKLNPEDQTQFTRVLLLLGITQHEFEQFETYFKDQLEYTPQYYLVLNRNNLTLLKRNILWARIAEMPIDEWILFMNMHFPKVGSVKKLVANGQWPALLSIIHQYKRLGIPVKLIDFYLKGIPNNEWSYEFEKEDIVLWLTDLKTNKTQFADLEEFSASVASLLNTENEMINLLFTRWLELFGVEDPNDFLIKSINIYLAADEEEGKIEDADKNENASVLIPENIINRTMAFMKFLDKNLQFLSFLELNSKTLNFFFNNLNVIGVNKKNPAVFLLNLCDYSKWMKGLQNNIQLFDYLFIDQQNNDINEELENAISSILFMNSEELLELNTVFEWKPQRLSNWNTFFNAINLCNELSWSPSQLSNAVDIEKISQGSPSEYYEQLSLFFEQTLQNSGFSEEKKLKIIKQVENQLLEQKRDVLVGLLKSPIFGFESSSKIYEYFLLDVETSVCSEVSKIKAAILSIQLFIHRCLMNLEEHKGTKIRFDNEAKEEWEWRKNYRVWEVNRKIFLYPENYLDPSLRDNKTPIFESLEGDMQQRDLSKEAIEQVYKRYLKEFSTVAKLNMAGSFYDNENNVHYYFGRTTNKPYRYYYKTYKKKSRAWSPWYPINVNIDSGYLAGIVAYGRMYIFWKTTQVITNTEFGGGDSGIQQNTSKSLKQIINYCFMEEDDTWSSPIIIDANINAEVIIPDQNPTDGLHMEIEMNASPGLFEEYILLRRLNNKLAVSFSNKVLFPGGDVIEREEAKIEIDIVSHKFLGKANNIDNQVPPSLAGYATLTDRGIELFRPEGNFSEYYYMNSVTGSSGSSTLGPVITSSKKLSVINGQEIGNYVVDNAGMNYQYLAFNNGLYPLNSYVVTRLSNIIFTQGLDSFLKPEIQMNTKEVSHIQIADSILAPNNLFMPKNGLDFNGPNGVYFKELYFHIPFTLARYYNQQQKYSEADYWYKKIFNPTVDFENDHKYWQYVPFRLDVQQQTSNILQDTVALEKYHEDPFNPHAIARLRTSSYPKAVVMGYIDNLLDWGDHLFREDTYESINEAMMLYITGQQLLGQKPQSIVSCKAINEEMTIADIENSLTLGNEILIEVESLNAENQLLSAAAITSENILLNNAIGGLTIEAEHVMQTNSEMADSTMSQSFVSGILFCIPWNDTLLQYWDRIEDRMFKIRNCLNIDGEYRQLALFEPSIDPMLLVRAKAAGIDIGQLTGNNRRLPYRFNYLLEKAKSYLSVVQNLGQTLLSTLEKQDGEALNELRTIHESNILQLMTLNKERQIEELEYEKINLEISKGKISANIEHLEELLNSLTDFKLADIYLKKATAFAQSSQMLNLLSSIIYLVPQLGAPTAMKFGGKEMGDALKTGSETLGIIGASNRMTADIIEKSKNNTIRDNGWKLNLLTSQKDLESNKNAFLVNELKSLIAERDLEIHRQNIEQNQEILGFYAEKLANKALYNTMAGHLTKLFRDTYGLAQEMAMEAQKAFQFEINDDTNSFIGINNWDTASMGLLSAEKLQYQLMQMETAYMEQNKRKAEIRSHVSMAVIDSKALLALKNNGACELTIPEEWFDIQYPGQYKRKIKSVSVSIPCVTGPYVNVPCKLTLQNSRMRITNNLSSGLVDTPKIPDRIFTSSAQNDSGLLEFNFRDERYLPFEGAGVDSIWNLQLPGKLRPFNYNTISDVIFHINYTAEYDETLREEVEENIEASINALNANGGLVKVMSLKHEFPNEWYRATSENTSMEIIITEGHFPYFTNGGNLSLQEASLEVIDIENPDESTASSSVGSVSGTLPETVTITVDEDEKDKELFLVLRYEL